MLQQIHALQEENERRWSVEEAFTEAKRNDRPVMELLYEKQASEAQNKRLHAELAKAEEKAEQTRLQLRRVESAWQAEEEAEGSPKRRLEGVQRIALRRLGAMFRRFATLAAVSSWAHAARRRTIKMCVAACGMVAMRCREQRRIERDVYVAAAVRLIARLCFHIWHKRPTMERSVEVKFCNDRWERRQEHWREQLEEVKREVEAGRLAKVAFQIGIISTYAMPILRWHLLRKSTRRAIVIWKSSATGVGLPSEWYQRGQSRSPVVRSPSLSRLPRAVTPNKYIQDLPHPSSEVDPATTANARLQANQEAEGHVAALRARTSRDKKLILQLSNQLEAERSRSASPASVSPAATPPIQSSANDTQAPGPSIAAVSPLSPSVLESVSPVTSRPEPVPERDAASAPAPVPAIEETQVTTSEERRAQKVLSLQDQLATTKLRLASMSPEKEEPEPPPIGPRGAGRPPLEVDQKIREFQKRPPAERRVGEPSLLASYTGPKIGKEPVLSLLPAKGERDERSKRMVSKSIEELEATTTGVKLTGLGFGAGLEEAKRKLREMKYQRPEEQHPDADMGTGDAGGGGDAGNTASAKTEWLQPERYALGAQHV